MALELTAVEIVEIVAVDASVTGSVMSYSAAQSSAAAQQRMANLNFLAQRQNAQQAIESAQVQYQANQTLAKRQADAQQRNAKALQDQATATEAQGRVNEDQTRADNARLSAIARAKLAHAGVVEEGTPLADLAEIAGEGALAVAQQHWQSSEQAKNLQFEAELAKNDAGETMYGAAVQGFRDKSAEVAGQNAITAAALNRMAGINQASQMRDAAGATLVSGLAQSGGQAATYRWRAG